MPRTTLTKTTLTTRGFPTDGVTATATAADVSNKNQVRLTGKEIVLARNSGAQARTVTISSVAINGRLGDITADSIEAGATHVYGPFDLNGWMQSDGYLYLEANHAEVLFTVLVVP